jgi:DNA-binding CsgD family transcriptional regulator
MIHTPAEERIRRALPAAAQLAGITADARQLGILARAAARAAQAPQERTRHSEPVRAQQLAPVLTDRDVAVLRMLAAGATPAVVAAELGVSYEGARSRISRMLARFGVGTRIEAVARGYELGLLGGES